MMTRFASISICSIFLLVLFTTQVGATTRHCDANYVWETTGGSIRGSFGAFKGKGECGQSVPNRCRIRARNAIERCAKVHWEKRWDRKVPEACIQNNWARKRRVLGWSAGQHFIDVNQDDL